MNGNLVSVLLWGFLAILTMFLAEIFGYVFYKDRDSRKLMFMLAFAFASLSYIPKMQTGWESLQIMENLWRWGSLPLVSAILIAVLSSLLKIEDFDNLYKAFLFTIATSIFMIVVPLPVNFLPSLIFQGMSMIVIVVSIYLILTRRKISDLMFLLSIMCFTLGGLGLAGDLAIEFNVFAFVFAYVFIALVFATSEGSVKGGMASFFALKRELEKTQEERKLAEEALSKSEEKFRNIFEGVNDEILYLDKYGKIVDVNKRVEDIFGYKRDEVIGKNFARLGFLQPKDLPIVFKLFVNAIRGGVVKPLIELETKDKKGNIVPVEASTRLIKKDGKIKGLLVIVRDITERKQMQKKLEEYSQQLEELVEKRTRQLKEAQEQLLKSERLAAIGEVAAMVGHDLRNPLTGIAGATYYLKTKFSPKIDKKTKEMLELIEKDIEYSNKIISGLFDYSREIRLELTETTPKSIIKDALTLVKVPKNIRILDLTENKPKIEIDFWNRHTKRYCRKNLDTTFHNKSERNGIRLVHLQTHSGSAQRLNFCRKHGWKRHNLHCNTSNQTKNRRR